MYIDFNGLNKFCIHSKMHYSAIPYFFLFIDTHGTPKTRNAIQVFPVFLCGLKLTFFELTGKMTGYLSLYWRGEFFSLPPILSKPSLFIKEQTEKRELCLEIDLFNLL